MRRHGWTSPRSEWGSNTYGHVHVDPNIPTSQHPYFPHMLLIVERESGMILVSELLKPEPSLEAMRGSVPVRLVYQFANMGVVPRQIRVRSPLLGQLLQPLAEELGFKIKRTRVLRSLDQAKAFLLQRAV